MAEQRTGRAEQAQRDAHDTVGQVEAQVALLTRELHQAREDHNGLQTHFEVRRSLPAALCALCSLHVLNECKDLFETVC